MNVIFKYYLNKYLIMQLLTRYTLKENNEKTKRGNTWA